MLSYQGLAHQTIKTYLSAVRHMHTFLGNSPLPRLWLVLNGALRLQPVLRRGTPRNRLPITPHILSQLRTVWVSHQDRAYGAMLWAAATTCFFGFLRSGEITTPSLSGYDPQSHLSWGDVAIDKFASPSCVRVHLRRSKCDPFGRGVDVYFGRTDNVVCPVRALLTYVASRGNHAGPFFVHPDSTPLTKTHFTDASPSGAPTCWIRAKRLRWPQFPHRCGYNSRFGRHGGLSHTNFRPLVQRCIRVLHPHTPYPARCGFRPDLSPSPSTVAGS